MASVTLKKIVKKFGSLEVVHSLDLHIEHNEFVVLVGPSGCGKSTTLRMIAGLEPLSSGDIYIGDNIVNDLPPRDRNVSMVFQNYALYPHMTVGENLGFSLKIANRSEAEIKQAVQEAAEILSLSELLERRPSELSGGQRHVLPWGVRLSAIRICFSLMSPYRIWMQNCVLRCGLKLKSFINELRQPLSM